AILKYARQVSQYYLITSACYFIRDGYKLATYISPIRFRQYFQNSQIPVNFLSPIFIQMLRRIPDLAATCEHGPRDTCDCALSATGTEQSLEELEYSRSACSAAQDGDVAKLRRILQRNPASVAAIHLCITRPGEGTLVPLSCCCTKELTPTRPRGAWVQHPCTGQPCRVTFPSWRDCWQLARMHVQ
ncbi:hypothetical protein Vafri_19793, partial [Volvox africanus]